MTYQGCTNYDIKSSNQISNKNEAKNTKQQISNKSEARNTKQQINEQYLNRRKEELSKEF